MWLKEWELVRFFGFEGLDTGILWEKGVEC
jgi:hypothetical protein